MRIKRFVFTTLTIIIVSTASVRATDLRGRVDGPIGPRPGIVIGLFVQLPNGAFQIVRQAVTGPDGMYYLQGIPPGQFILQIAGVNYPLGVAIMQLQDIPPIFVR